MKMMKDEIFDRHYQSGREHAHAGIDRLVQRFATAVSVTFRTIKREIGRAHV